jgi:hypothetical protein
MEEILVAPCGMNCNICKSHLRRYKACLGCNDLDNDRFLCIFHKCEILKTNKSGLCLECELYPCKQLEKLDKKHRERDGMSMIANLGYIREHGMRAFLESEEKKWRCPECGGVIYVGAWSIACSACVFEITRIIKEGKKYHLIQVWDESKKTDK